MGRGGDPRRGLPPVEGPGRDLSLIPDLDEIQQVISIPDRARPYLERMDLAERAVVFALVSGELL